MAKTICTVLGIVFLLVGLLGFLAPGLLGMHLNLTHNLVHLISGAVALYVGLKGTYSAARTLCILFGIVYLLLGIAGFLAGGAGSHGIAGVPADHHGTGDSSLLKVLPGSLELASIDHIVHILLGIVFLAGAFLSKPDVRHATD